MDIQSFFAKGKKLLSKLKAATYPENSHGK
jgi:hypothetical protein